MLRLRNLIGSSSRRLIVAVMLFICLDLSILVTNLQIARQVEMDAVAINLAGRQRMLSQRITKAVMLATDPGDKDRRASAVQELTESYAMFSTTLHAFEQGGPAIGGDGQPVLLRRVEQARAREAVGNVIEILAPWHDRIRLSGGIVQDKEDFRHFMEQNNLQILKWMNQLTTALEQESVDRIGVLRTIQTVAFILALLNFLAIVQSMYRQHRQADDARMHWQQAAQRDELTGALNKAAFAQRFRELVKEMASTQGSMALLVFDLDGFKRVNDEFGHAVGDMVLNGFASALKSQARDSDIFARIGGDEFCLLCPGMQQGQGLDDFCDRLLVAIAAIRIPEYAEIEVRASIGVALRPRDGETPESLFNAADAAMYVAKRKGGERYMDTSASAV